MLETRARDTRPARSAVTDFMPPDHDHPSIHRIVECRSGTVDMEMELVVRFDYGSIVPWVESTGDGLRLVAGPDGLRFHSGVPLEGRDRTTVAELDDGRGQPALVLAHLVRQLRARALPVRQLRGPRAAPGSGGRTWVGRCTYEGGWRDEVVRSLITLKALTYAPTGAVCAAATTSLPEGIGGVRNWDYRYSWLRDATMTLQAFLISGYVEEAADVGSLAPPGGGRQPRRLPDHVRRARRAPPHRARARLAPRLRGLDSRCGSATRHRPSSSSTCSAS